MKADALTSWLRAQVEKYVAPGMSIDTNAHDIRASLGVAIPWNRVPWSSNNKKSTRQILRVQVEQTVFPVNKAVLLKGDVVPRLDHFSVRVIDISPPIFATLNLVFRIRAFLPIYSLKFLVVFPLVLRWSDLNWEYLEGALFRFWLRGPVQNPNLRPCCRSC